MRKEYRGFKNSKSTTTLDSNTIILKNKTESQNWGYEILKYPKAKKRVKSIKQQQQNKKVRCK